MTKTTEYAQNMERLRKAQEGIATLMANPANVQRLTDDTLGDFDYACEWLEIVLGHMEGELHE